MKHAVRLAVCVPLVLISYLTPMMGQAGMPAPDPAQIRALLPDLERLAQDTVLDLARLRIDRWKASSEERGQAQARADSLDRNLRLALPTMILQVRTSPGNLEASFKLYRNISALYDVLVNLTAAAGTFGAADDYQTLSSDASKLDGIRRSLADRVQSLAAFNDSQLNQLRAQLAQAKSAQTPPKKIIVDDNEPPRKVTPKKKVVSKPPATSTPPPTKPAQ